MDKLVGFPLVQVEGVQLLRESAPLDWSIEPGSRWGVLGDAQSGSSQLLRVLSGLTPPISGKLFWKGIEVNSRARKALSQLGKWVTLIYPNPYTALEPWHPVRDFLVKGAVQWEQGVLSPAILDYPVRALSGVARIRLMFLQALAVNPAVILVDDVANWVVPEALPGLIKMMDAALGPERALVVISHSPEALHSLPDWLVLEQGRMTACGPQTRVQIDAT